MGRVPKHYRRDQKINLPGTIGRHVHDPENGYAPEPEKTPWEERASGHVALAESIGCRGRVPAAIIFL